MRHCSEFLLKLGFIPQRMPTLPTIGLDSWPFQTCSISLFQNSQLTVFLTVQNGVARENVRRSGDSYCTVTINNRQLSILEKLMGFVSWTDQQMWKNLSLWLNANQLRSYCVCWATRLFQNTQSTVPLDCCWWRLKMLQFFLHRSVNRWTVVTVLLDVFKNEVNEAMNGWHILQMYNESKLYNSFS